MVLAFSALDNAAMLHHQHNTWATTLYVIFGFTKGDNFIGRQAQRELNMADVVPSNGGATSSSMHSKHTSCSYSQTSQPQE